MTASGDTEIPIETGDDVVRVRQAARAAAGAARLSLVDQTKVVTAASELARNTLVYGGGGVARVSQVTDERGKAGVRIVFHDDGPGIPDVDLALTDGWTSGQGLGLGLAGARRLVDAFELETSVGVGTTVTVTKWRR
ncbi:ATP-binding protein [Actinomadura graeca]|uniref:ATP-binding protein n=1 Tax=Actinomadura graeca TaxID=2750812 RepID=A0ABX8R299_9ACTN|nr:ATP-binding protein [Actinomadura graeca]QXJ23123.1 ATP-binding protein [Actinomadura graeca]